MGVQRRVDREAGCDRQQRVAVGICPRDRLGGEIARCARAVFDDHRLAEISAQLFAHETGEHIKRAAGAKRHHEFQRLGWISLRPRPERPRRSRATEKTDKLPSPHIRPGVRRAIVSALMPILIGAESCFAA